MLKERVTKRGLEYTAPRPVTRPRVRIETPPLTPSVRTKSGLYVDTGMWNDRQKESYINWVWDQAVEAGGLEA